MGVYRHADRKTTLFGDNSILGRSMSLYEMDEQSGNIDACCTVTEVTRSEFMSLKAMAESQFANCEADD